MSHHYIQVLFKFQPHLSNGLTSQDGGRVRRYPWQMLNSFLWRNHHVISNNDHMTNTSQLFDHVVSAFTRGVYGVSAIITFRENTWIEAVLSLISCYEINTSRRHLKKVFFRIRCPLLGFWSSRIENVHNSWIPNGFLRSEFRPIIFCPLVEDIVFSQRFQSKKHST